MLQHLNKYCTITEQLYNELNFGILLKCQLFTKCATFVTSVYLSGVLEEHFQSILVWKVRNFWAIY